MTVAWVDRRTCDRAGQAVPTRRLAFPGRSERRRLRLSARTGWASSAPHRFDPSQTSPPGGLQSRVQAVRGRPGTPRLRRSIPRASPSQRAPAASDRPHTGLAVAHVADASRRRRSKPACRWQVESAAIDRRAHTVADNAAVFPLLRWQGNTPRIRTGRIGPFAVLPGGRTRKRASPAAVADLCRNSVAGAPSELRAVPGHLSTRRDCRACGGGS